MHIRDIDEEAGQDLTRLQSSVTPLRWARALKYHRHDDRLRCLGAGLLLKRVLGVERDEDLSYGPYGKPLLAASFVPCGANKAGSRRHFSLAHGGDYVILVTHDSPVGVDIEPISPEHDETFLRDWTAREAILKLTGEGFQRDPLSIDLNTAPYTLEYHLFNSHVYCIAV